MQPIVLPYPSVVQVLFDWPNGTVSTAPSHQCLHLPFPMPDRVHEKKHVFFYTPEDYNISCFVFLCVLTARRRRFVSLFLCCVASVRAAGRVQTDKRKKKCPSCSEMNPMSVKVCCFVGRPPRFSAAVVLAIRPSEAVLVLPTAQICCYPRRLPTPNVVSRVLE